MSTMKSLKERAKEFEILLPFMEGREKGDFDRLYNDTFTIEQFGYLKDTDSKGNQKEYVCFTVKEDKQHFYFGGQVLTDNLRQLEAEGYKEEIEKEGLPVEFGKKKSKNNLTYTTVTFFPDNMEDKPKDNKKNK